MNPLTNVRKTAEMNDRELALGVTGNLKQSWHQKYKDSAWIYVGGLPFDLTEGDVTCVFSQYGEIVNINLLRDRTTGKSRGFCFLCYEDQRSTVLAVDNLNGIKLLGRIVRVDHVENYKVPKDHEDMEPEARQLMEEGCAPRPIGAETRGPKIKNEPDSCSETEYQPVVRDRKHKKDKKKKHKKEKRSKMKRKRQSTSDAGSSDEHAADGDSIQRRTADMREQAGRSDRSNNPTDTNVQNLTERSSGRIDSHITDRRAGMQESVADDQELQETDAPLAPPTSQPAKKSHPAFKSKLFSKKVRKTDTQEPLKDEKKFSHDIQPNIPDRYN